VLVIVAVGLLHSPGVGAHEAARSPAVSAPAAARPGDIVVVTLTNWPRGVVTLSVCSNGAARGTQDCALEGDSAISVRDDRPVQTDLQVTLPPGPCPCVVRATTPTGTPVVTTPLVVVGVPTAPIVLPASPPAAEELHVQARVETPTEKFPQSAVAPLGGSVHKVLVVTVKNDATDAADLHVVAEVGKHDTKEPIGARNATKVQPGETRTLRMPFVVSTPAWGTYHVTGTVYGGASPVTFTTKADNDPWLLMLMVPVALIVIAELMRARERRRRRAEAAAVSTPAAGPSIDDWVLPSVPAHAGDAQSSPDVGIAYAERYEGSPYDPSRYGGAADASDLTVPVGAPADGAASLDGIPVPVPASDVTAG
jgi:hypothetical protein